MRKPSLLKLLLTITCLGCVLLVLQHFSTTSTKETFNHVPSRQLNSANEVHHKVISATLSIDEKTREHTVEQDTLIKNNEQVSGKYQVVPVTLITRNLDTNKNFHLTNSHQPTTNLTGHKEHSVIAKKLSVKVPLFPVVKKDNVTVRTGPNPSGRCEITLANIQNVKKFVFFIGYPRSGHSIVASLLDAHPHIILAHEFSLFDWLPKQMDNLKLNTKQMLFDALSHNSYLEAIHGERSGHYNNKGYTLNTASYWHGRCERYLQVIGDKKAGATSNVYLDSPEAFNKSYYSLLKLVDMPLHIFHVVRNPYDLISTSLLYETARLKNNGIESGDNAYYVTEVKKNFKTTGRKLKKYSELRERIDVIFKLADAVMGIKNMTGASNVLEIHNCDLIKNAGIAVREMCNFLDIKCPLDYIMTCVNKVFRTVSKSRDMVVWPEGLKAIVEKRKQNYPFFRRYSFNGDC